MGTKRLVIAGTGSGVGKTTFTIGLMVALRRRNLKVQGFKCGPDYIDPSYHTAVTGRISRNLDSWMLKDDLVKDIFKRASEDADISIIEGVMGFFDGKEPTSNGGSTAEISVLTKSPVVLVVNCASMARSAAAIVKGFQELSTEPNIVAVIANNVGSEGHFRLVKIAIEQECHIPVVGFLKKDAAIAIPERYLGLIPSIERGELDSFFEKLGNLISNSVDIDRLLKLAEAEAEPLHRSENSIFDKKREKTVTIAVARDSAFNFYYEENLELLSSYGASLRFFSPLNGEVLPEDADGLYIGGGFPEEFAPILAEKEEVKRSIRDAINKGLPTLAECGGFMFLTEAIETVEGKTYSMAEVIPGRAVMQKKLAALGYREVTGRKGNPLLPEGALAKGHEFHYSNWVVDAPITHAYGTKSRWGRKQEGYLSGNLVAGYTHFHFASSPEMAERWIEKCKEEKHHEENSANHDSRYKF